MCDRRIPDEFAAGHYTPVAALAGALASSRLPDDLISDPRIYQDIRDGELVWVRLAWLKSFIKTVLPRVRGRFVLVTGDSDTCVPSELAEDARAILDSPNVVHWFTQNYDGSPAPEKISPVPIGLDFHMLSQRPIWGEKIATPEEQERTLRAIAQELPPLHKRVPRVYIDFAWQRSWGLRSYRRFHPLQGAALRESRRKIVKTLQNRDGVFCQTVSLPRNEMWRRRGEYAFVLSPHGTGLDCHRTWEALALGHIVLTPSSSLNQLYEGLPVIPLTSWDEITPENLRRWLAAAAQGERFHPQLTSNYWIEKMRATARNAVSHLESDSRVAG